jgi:hypothetical protein
MRSGVHNDLRPQVSYGLGQVIQTGEVTAGLRAASIQRDQLPQWRQTSLQLPTDLSVFPQE